MPYIPLFYKTDRQPQLSFAIRRSAICFIT
nr:MAG TPA: hypothetical protein [Caudoviricetes sp.]